MARMRLQFSNNGLPKIVGLAFSLVVMVGSLAAKEVPFQVVTWPDSGAPSVRFTFSKFKEVGGLGKERTYITDAIAENLSDKTVGEANFSLYVFDKNKARIGEGYIHLT